MIRIQVIASIIVLMFAVTNAAQTYQLVWSDEFNGNSLDTGKWGYQNICDGAGNNELECYTGRTQNVAVRNGTLVITPLVENYGGKQYTSGRISTSGKSSWKYGRFEVRAKIPDGLYLWPAIWMMPEKSVYGTWAASGEIDIMENHGGQNTEHSSTLHYGGSWPKNTYASSGSKYESFDLTKDFHVYSAIWTPDSIQFAIDGKAYHTQTLQKSFNNAGAGSFPYKQNGSPFDQNFHFIINLAIGGGFFGSKSQALTPAIARGWASPQFVVDYARVYQLKDEVVTPPAPVPAPAPNPTKAATPTTKAAAPTAAIPYCPTWYSTCDQACYRPEDYTCTNGVLTPKKSTTTTNNPPAKSTTKDAPPATSSSGSNNACLAKRLADVKAGKVPARGGNLGSWFIQEGWMVGWLWQQNGCNVGQYPGTTLLEKCLGNKASSVMQKHWSTFITEDDFKVMASYNLNHVRLPVGWWQIYDTVGGASKAQLKQNVSPTNYLVGGLAWIDKAFEWGEKWGIGILLDIHAAPGSQNGNDHSAPPEPGKVLWTQYTANQAQTSDSVELYAQRYANRTALLGFCLMNEPMGNVQLYKNYYQTAYQRVRKYSKDAIVVINPLISNQDIDNDEWNNFMNEPAYTNVWMSVHWYNIWGFEGKSDAWKLNYINNDRSRQVQSFLSKNPKKGIVDEWSNGGIADGKASMQAQLAQFNKMDGGWSFWAWPKTNGGDSWSLKAAFEKGWITPGQTGVAAC